MELLKILFWRMVGLILIPVFGITLIHDIICYLFGTPELSMFQMGSVLGKEYGLTDFESHAVCFFVYVFIIFLIWLFWISDWPYGHRRKLMLGQIKKWKRQGGNIP